MTWGGDVAAKSCNSSDSETGGDLLPGSGCTLSNGTVGGSEGRTVGVTWDGDVAAKSCNSNNWFWCGIDPSPGTKSLNERLDLNGSYLIGVSVLSGTAPHAASDIEYLCDNSGEDNPDSCDFNDILDGLELKLRDDNLPLSISGWNCAISGWNCGWVSGRESCGPKEGGTFLFCVFISICLGFSALGFLCVNLLSGAIALVPTCPIADFADFSKEVFRVPLFPSPVLEGFRTNGLSLASKSASSLLGGSSMGGGGAGLVVDINFGWRGDDTGVATGDDIGVAIDDSATGVGDAGGWEK